MNGSHVNEASSVYVCIHLLFVVDRFQGMRQGLFGVVLDANECEEVASLLAQPNDVRSDGNSGVTACLKCFFSWTGWEPCPGNTLQPQACVVCDHASVVEKTRLSLLRAQHASGRTGQTAKWCATAFKSVRRFRFLTHT